MAQAPLQSPFYYYNPESEKARPPQLYHQPQGHFYAMPPQNTDYFSQPYVHPRSQSSHMMFQPPSQYISQAMLTPAASPKPMHQKPTILVQQEIPCIMPVDGECGDYRFGPATPTLSATSSMCDSPPSAYPMLPTPGNDMYLSSFDSSVKQCADEDMFSDVLTHGGDWAKSGSPPLTPGK